MVRTARKTVLSRRLVMAAIAFAGIAGCQMDRPRAVWRSSPDGESRMDCPGRCHETSRPCGVFQPTVWQSWNFGPMAVRGCDPEQTAEPNPAWLNDLPKPGGTPGVKPSQETIPAPPAKANEGSTSGLGDGFKLQPAATSVAYIRAEVAAKPELGEGFKLESHAPQGEPSEATIFKTGDQGLEETTPDTSRRNFGAWTTSGDVAPPPPPPPPPSGRNAKQGSGCHAICTGIGRFGSAASHRAEPAAGVVSEQLRSRNIAPPTPNTDKSHHTKTLRRFGMPDALNRLPPPPHPPPPPPPKQHTPPTPRRQISHLEQRSNPTSAFS